MTRLLCDMKTVESALREIEETGCTSRSANAVFIAEERLRMVRELEEKFAEARQVLGARGASDGYRESLVEAAKRASREREFYKERSYRLAAELDDERMKGGWPDAAQVREVLGGAYGDGISTLTHARNVVEERNQAVEYERQARKIFRELREALGLKENDGICLTDQARGLMRNYALDKQCADNYKRRIIDAAKKLGAPTLEAGVEWILKERDGLRDMLGSHQRVLENVRVALECQDGDDVVGRANAIIGRSKKYANELDRRTQDEEEATPYA